MYCIYVNFQKLNGGAVTFMDILFHNDGARRVLKSQFIYRKNKKIKKNTLPIYYNVFTNYRA